MDQLSKGGLDIAYILNEIGDFLESDAKTDADTVSTNDETDSSDSDSDSYSLLSEESSLRIWTKSSWLLNSLLL